MNKTLYLYFVLFPLFVVCQTNNIDEKIGDWIFPRENNFRWYKVKSFDTGNDNNSSLKMEYYKISENQIGISESVLFTGEESTTEFRLYEILNDEIKLLKLKTIGFPGVEPIEYSFDKNNVYWKLPSSNEVVKWDYTEEGGTFYRCKSYWKVSTKDGKLLVIEKEIFEGEEVEFSREKTIEYYKKGGGLDKFELYKARSDKLFESYISQEGGFDINVVSQDFPLRKKEDSSLENTNRNENIITTKKIIYPPGTIPKEYRMQLLIDKGFPYLVKDTISIKNKRGQPNIPPPKFNKSENSIFYDGKENYSDGDGWLVDAKLIAVTYFASPYSTKQEAYYSDGEGNIKIVKNLGLYIEEDNTIKRNSSGNYSMKEVVEKDSNLYLELSKEINLKKQGIYIIRYNTSEENVKSRTIFPIKFTSQE